MTDHRAGSSARFRWEDWADLLAAAVAAGLGLLLWVGAGEINLGVGYDRIGPRFFPYGVAAGLMLVAGVLAARVLLGKRDRASAARQDGPDEDRVAWGPFTWVVVALLLEVLLLERAGFVIASAAQFWLVARAFQSKRPVRDALVAVLLSIVVYYAFSRGLGLSLPAGILEALPSQ